MDIDVYSFFRLLSDTNIAHSRTTNFLTVQASSLSRHPAAIRQTLLNPVGPVCNVESLLYLAPQPFLSRGASHPRYEFRSAFHHVYPSVLCPLGPSSCYHGWALPSSFQFMIRQRGSSVRSLLLLISIASEKVC